MTAKDGGAAFPGFEHYIAVRDHPPEHQVITGEPHGGMTIRQFYKAAAMAGMGILRSEGKLIQYECMANVAGKIADALISEDEAHGREGK